MVYQDRVSLVITRRCVFGRDRRDILIALGMLGMVVADDVDHPLVDLYKGLCLSKDDDLLYLSVEHCKLLGVSIERMSRFN